MAEKEDIQHEELQEEQYDALSKTEVLLEEKKDLITKVLAGVVIIVLGITALNSWVWGPAEIEASNEIWPAQYDFETDSFALAVEGMEAVAGEYGSTDAGNIANLYLGIAQLNQKNFEEAREALEDFNASGKVFPAMKVGLIGDTYSEEGEWEQAVSYYEKAAKISSINTVSAFFLKKAGILLEQNGQASEAVEVYENILNKYLLKGAAKFQQERKEIEKLYERAKNTK